MTEVSSLPAPLAASTDEQLLTLAASSKVSGDSVTRTASCCIRMIFSCQLEHLLAVRCILTEQFICMLYSGKYRVATLPRNHMIGN